MELTVIKVSESKTKGQFITKLQAKTEASINLDGLPVPGTQVTYYIMLTQAMVIGTKVNINLDNYRISCSEFIPDDSDDAIMLKWLNPIH